MRQNFKSGLLGFLLLVNCGLVVLRMNGLEVGLPLDKSRIVHESGFSYFYDLSGWYTDLPNDTSDFPENSSL